MARNFGKTETGFWDNPKVRRLSDDGRTMLHYCFSCPGSTAAGSYVLPMAHMVDHLQWAQDRILKTLHELARKPFVLWDADTRLLYIPGWWGHNGIENPKVATHVARLLLALPDCPYKANAIEDLKAVGRYPQVMVEVFGNWRLPDGAKTPDLFGGPRAALPLPAPEPPAAEAPKRGTRIEVTWLPSDEMRAYATGRGLNDADIDREVTKFVRYWTGPDATTPAKKDWGRTWANWIDKAAERLPKVNGNGHANGSSKPIKIVNGYEVWDGTVFLKSGPEDAIWLMRAEGWLKRRSWQSSWGPEPGSQGCKCPAELLAPVE